MQITIAVARPVAQWKILTASYRLLVAGHLSRRDALDVLELADADVPDLVAVQQAGLVDAWPTADTADYWGHDRAVDLDAELPTAVGEQVTALRRLSVLLTPAGGRWLNSDPHNRLLHVLYGFRPLGRGVYLHRLVGRHDVDPHAVADSHDRGWVQVEDRTAGTPLAGVTPRLLADAARDRDDIAVVLTDAGRTIADPTDT